jgi:hypothetical protein
MTAGSDAQVDHGLFFAEIEHALLASSCAGSTANITAWKRGSGVEATLYPLYFVFRVATSLGEHMAECQPCHHGEVVPGR